MGKSGWYSIHRDTFQKLVKVLTFDNESNIIIRNRGDITITKRKKRIAMTISITKLFRKFPTEQSCIDWLETARWHGKPVCPHCSGDENISKPASKSNTYWHKDCRNHFTVKTGTVMHSSKTDTRNWMVAIYYYITARKGISAVQLSKELGVQYRTAWHIGHRIREACREGGDFILDKIVEIDANKHNSKKTHAGRGTVGKQAVIGMRERESKVNLLPVRTRRPSN